MNVSRAASHIIENQANQPHQSLSFPPVEIKYREFEEITVSIVIVRIAMRLRARDPLRVLEVALLAMTGAAAVVRPYLHYQYPRCIAA